MHAIKPIGRFRVLAVLAALCVSVLAGALPADAAPKGSSLSPDRAEQVVVVADETDDGASTQGWNWARSEEPITTQGWNWARSGGGEVSTQGWNWAR